MNVGFESIVVLIPVGVIFDVISQKSYYLSHSFFSGVYPHFGIMGLGVVVVVNDIFCASQLFGDDVHHVTIDHRDAMNQRDEAELQIVEPFASDLYRRTHTMKLAICPCMEYLGGNEAFIGRVKYALVALVLLVLSIAKNDSIWDASLNQEPSASCTQCTLVADAILFV